MTEPALTIRKGSDPKERKDFELELKRRAALSERYKEVWAALNRWVNSKHAFLVSAPGDLNLRLEIPSSLADEVTAELRKMGYCPVFAGTDQRIECGAFVPIHRFTFRIPLPTS
jgi:hypothetical protein